jgi:hypothetical protein
MMVHTTRSIVGQIREKNVLNNGNFGEVNTKTNIQNYSL